MNGLINISDGKECKVPDVVNLTKSEAIKRLKNAKLNYSFVYKSSSSIKKDRVISQSISAGKKVSINTTVTITLSNGKESTKIVQARKNTTNKSSSKPKTPTTPARVCKTCSFRASQITSILQQYTTYSSAASALKNYLRSQCSGLTVNISGKALDGYDPGDYVSGFRGGDVNSCSSISIVLAK